MISDEQTSQTYLTPPSLPLVMVFLRITPISPVAMSGGELDVTPPVGSWSEVWGHSGRDDGPREG